MEKPTDLYASYLCTRLKFKAQAKQDLGNVSFHEIALLTYWNLCMSDKVLTEKEFWDAMNAGYDSLDARVKNPELFGQDPELYKNMRSQVCVDTTPKTVSINS